MENDEKTLTGEESLKIITDMINKTKVSINQVSFHLLFWGWLIFGCSLTEYLLYRFTEYASPWYIWFMVIPGIFVSITYGFITGRRVSVYTYATGLYVWTWFAFMVSAILLSVILWSEMESFAPFILTLSAIPTLISGLIIKFRPLIFGAVSFWFFALVARFGGQDLSVLAVPMAMLTGYLIPGYILKKRNNNATV